MSAINNIIELRTYLKKEEESLANIGNQKLEITKCEFCLKKAMEHLPICLDEKNKSIKKWLFYVTDIFRMVVNLAIKIQASNELAIKVFKELIRLTFESKIVDIYALESIDDDTYLSKYIEVAIFVTKNLTKCLNDAGRFKESLAVLTILPFFDQNFAQNDYSNSLITIWVGAKKAESKDFGKSLISCFELTKDMFKITRKMTLNYERSIMLCDLELKAIVEFWPNHDLLNMILETYYEFIDEKLGLDKLITIFVQILSVKKDIPSDWLRKWETLVLCHFPDVLNVSFSTSYLLESSDFKSTNDLLNYSLVFFCYFQLKLESFGKFDMSTFPMVDYLFTFNNYLSNGLVLFSMYLSNISVTADCSHYCKSINGLLTSIIFECRFNEFVDLEILAMKIYYQLNKLLKNTQEVLFIAAFLIEKLNMESKLFQELCDRVHNYEHQSCSNEKMTSRVKQLREAYVLHFKMKLCTRYINEQQIDKVTPLLAEIKRLVQEDRSVDGCHCHFAIYVKYLDYLMYFFPCDQHPVYKPTSEILFLEVRTLFSKGYSAETTFIQRALLVDVLNGLIAKESTTEQPHILLLYYRFMEKVAVSFKYRLMFEKVIYLNFLKIVRYSNIKNCNSMYDKLIKLSHIDYKSIETSDMDQLVSKTSSMQINDNDDDNTAKRSSSETFTDLEKTSEFLNEISRKKNSLNEMRILFHNIHASILLWLRKTEKSSKYLEKLFRIGIETYEMYMKSVKTMNCKDAENYFRNTYLEIYIPFLYDYGTYFSTFEKYTTALRVFEKILKISPNSSMLIHVKTVKFYTEMLIEKDLKKSTRTNT